MRGASLRGARYIGQQGFQLVEMLVVVVIVAVGAAISVPSLTGQSDKAHDSGARQTIAVAGKLAKALYLENNGRYPSTKDLPSLLRKAEGTDVYSFRTHIGYVSTSTGPEDVSVRSVDGHTFHACVLARTGRQFCGIFRDPSNPASAFGTEGVYTDYVETPSDRLILPNDDGGHKGYATSEGAFLFKPSGAFEIGAWVMLWDIPGGGDATIAAHGCTWSNGENCRTDNTGWSLAIDNDRRVHFAIATDPTAPVPAAGADEAHAGVFAATQVRTLTVTNTPTNGGTGAVTSSPAGINCGASCAFDFAKDASVTLTAAPAAGSVFAGWSGACSGLGSCLLTMNNNKAVTATFTTTRALTVTKSGAGTGTVSSLPAGVNCGSTCGMSFNAGTSVALTATPSLGSRFSGWSGDCTGTGCTVVMSADRTVNAVFVPTKNLSVAFVGSGTVSSSPAGLSCSSNCSTSFDVGTAVTLTATPAAGSSFSGWSGACSGSGSCVISLQEDQAVTATFVAAPVTRSLSLSFAGSGAGTVTSSPAGLNCSASCGYDFIKDTAVTLTATPAAGTTFSGWSGAGCSGSGACIVSMNANRNVTATFILTAHPLALDVEGTGAGSVASSPSGLSCSADCTVSFLEHTVVSLTATPAAGSRFTGWSGDCSGTGSCVVSMSFAHEVAANFATTTGGIEWVSEDWNQPIECRPENNVAARLSLGIWHYVSAHFDPQGRITVFVDGQRQECSGLIGGIVSDIASTEPLYIGAQVNPAQNTVGFLNGAVAELRMTAGGGPAHVADPGPRSSPGRLSTPAENGRPATFLFHFDDLNESMENLEDLVLHGYVALGY